MRRDPGTLAGPEFDLLVIGGGIFGAFAAWDAAGRGLRVGLIEAGDFAHATSSKHFRVVHGGIRYLQHGDLVRVRQSSRERSALLRIAPHLVSPLPILVPTYGHGRRGKGLLGLGCALYDLATLDRNRGIEDPARRIPRSRRVPREEALRAFPELSPEGLTGGVIFWDGQIRHPARLALAVLRSAVDTGGARIANYVAARGFLRDGLRVVGVQAEDVLTGERLAVRARVVLNAAGPWAAELLAGEPDLDLHPRRPTFSRDLGLVTRRPLHSEIGLASPIGSADADAVLDRGGRHLFLLPWQGGTLVGVWHKVHDGAADDVRVERAELQAYLQEANEAYGGLDLELSDVLEVLTGLVLFGDAEQDPERHEFGKRSLFLDHEEEQGVAGLLTLVGVRATVARTAAETAVDRALAKLGREGRASRTEGEPVWGGDFEAFETLLAAVARDAPRAPAAARRALAHNHGSRYPDVLEIAASDPALAGTIGASSTWKAEVVHAIRSEMAVTLDDVVARRTDLATGRRPEPDEVAECARIAGRELGWSEERIGREAREAERAVAPPRLPAGGPGAEDRDPASRLGLPSEETVAP